LANNVEILSLADSLVGLNGMGNDLNNTIFGNANNNSLNGGDGADHLNGLGGNDTFVFQAGQAHGDTVHEFNGNGAGAGDRLMFSGYGTIAQGATFRQLTATEWQVTSADGTIQENVTLAAGAVFDTTTDLLFV
jgi:Ca2+-binding RTX toxin-like protein